MIELTHNTAPRLLANRKENQEDNGCPQNPRKAWSNFSTKGKKEVHTNLIPLQSGLCVYCENKLTKYSFHIEHILSKSKNHCLTFEYSNLSLSCIKDGAISKETTTNPISCGHAPEKKANKYDKNLFIKPTESSCNSLFYYSFNGKIKFKDTNSEFDKKRVVHTTKVLNLNCNRLLREREEIILEGYNKILELIDNQEALDYFFDLEFKKINNQYLFPFISAREEHYKLFKKIET